MALRAVVVAAILIVSLSVLVAQPEMQTAPVSPTLSAAQAAAGRTPYDQQCASCHGSSLDNGEFGPSLSGEEFLQSLGNRPLSEVFDLVINTMPLAAPGSLSPEPAVNLLAYVPNSNAISYAVNGNQYIAVVAGNGGNHARLSMRMMPEIKNPANRSASVWVFEVPDGR